MAKSKTVQKTSHETLYDVVVVGAGPAGLTAALMLAHEGFSTALLSPSINLEDGRTTALMQASVAFLTRIGLWQALRPLATPLCRMRMIDDTGRLVRAPEVTFDSAELELEAFGYNLRNKEMNKVLKEAVEAETRLTFIEASADTYTFAPDHVAISTSDGAVIRASLCVAADGRSSKARQSAGIDVRQWSYPQVAVVMNLTHDQPHRETSTEFHTPTGPFTLVPLPGRASSLVCVEKPEVAQKLAGLPADELAAEVERRAHSVLGKMALDGTVQTYPLSGLTAKKVHAQRLVLIGETAHVFPPIGAQGLNLGLRDVESLERILVGARLRGQDIGSESVLAAYDRERQPDITSRTAAVDLLNRSLLTDFLPVQMARSLGMWLADKIGPFRRFLMREGIAPHNKSGFTLPLPFARRKAS